VAAVGRTRRPRTAARARADTTGTASSAGVSAALGDKGCQAYVPRAPRATTEALGPVNSSAGSPSVSARPRYRRSRLYRAEAGKPGDFPRLQPVLSRPVNLDLIRQQYDSMVKYATAHRLGAAETEAILRRFARNNGQDPMYKAPAELGKAFKTIFSCRYPQSEVRRRAIQEGLNVVENGHSADAFILFGKGGEPASNLQEDQDASILALHLLQISLVYINTLTVPRVLSRPSWSGRLTTKDLHALTRLIYGHFNPYNILRLGTDARLPIDPTDALAAHLPALRLVTRTLGLGRAPRRPKGPAGRPAADPGER
jgi:hypothetical protein